jgi:hypothetical protein
VSRVLQGLIRLCLGLPDLQELTLPYRDLQVIRVIRAIRVIQGYLEQIQRFLGLPVN